jgi:hypothetical protein
MNGWWQEPKRPEDRLAVRSGEPRQEGRPAAQARPGTA